MVDRPLRLWALVAILLLAFLVRMVGLGEESLWYDETVSAYLAGESVPELLGHTARDIHPPGYYLLLHGWRQLAGSSEFVLAFASLWFGVVLVALVWRLASRGFGPNAGFLAALLVAISPYNVWYSQEVRMYTLGACLALGALMAVLPLLESRAGSRPLPACLAGYVICAALGLWVLYYFAFLLLALNLLVGVWWVVEWRCGRGRWRWLLRWAVTQAAVLALYAPWLPAAWRQATEPPVPPWRSFAPLGRVLAETWSALSLGQSVDPAEVWPVLVLVALLFGLALTYRPTSWRFLPWFLAASVLLPLWIIYLSSFVTPLYHVRYAFLYSMPFYVLLGAGLAVLWQRWRPAGRLALLVLVASSILSIGAYHADPIYAGDDHRSASRFLADRWRPGDAILVDAGYVYTALLTYWTGDTVGWRGRLVGDDWPPGGSARVVPVIFEVGTVDGSPSLGWGDPRSDFYPMRWVETEAALGRLAAEFDRIWVYRCYDTVTDPEGRIRQWLDEHAVRFEDEVFNGEAQLRVQGFLTGRRPQPDEIRAADQGLTDGSLELVATGRLPAEVVVGSPLDLALVWRAGHVPADGRILFAGLFDGAGERWAQTDVRPLGPLYPVTAWRNGELVRTPLRLLVSPATPPGLYRVEVGWYRFVEAVPTWLAWGSGERFLVGEVQVTAPADWRALPQPAVSLPIGVEIGPGVTLLGLGGVPDRAREGEEIAVHLLWEASASAPEPGLAVLELVDDKGNVVVQAAPAPIAGRVPFSGLAVGQMVAEWRRLVLPMDLPAGVYGLAIGRQRADGSWMTVRRGPFSLSSTYPLATLRVLEAVDAHDIGEE